MNLTRRKFLKFLGLGAIALPVVAKAVEVGVTPKSKPLDYKEVVELVNKRQIFPMDSYGLGIMNKKYRGGLPPYSREFIASLPEDLRKAYLNGEWVSEPERAYIHFDEATFQKNLPELHKHLWARGKGGGKSVPDVKVFSKNYNTGL